jgi:hypothetical protein
VVERESGAVETLVQTVPGQIKIDAESRSIIGNITRWLMQALRGEASLS